MAADPHEMHNLAADPSHAARLATMRADVDEWMQQQGDAGKVFGQPLLLGEPVTNIIPTPRKK